MNPACLLGLALLGTPTIGQTARPEWQEFRSSAGAFTLQLPGVPREQKQSLATSSGPIELTLYVLEPDKGRGTYVVSFSEPAQSSPRRESAEKRLQDARDNAVKRAKGKLHADRALTLDGHPGREFAIEVEGQVRIRSRIYAVKDRLYQVLVVGPTGWPLSKDAGRFLDSFRLTP